MSVSSAQAKLQRQCKDLLVLWEQVHRGWNDATAERFARNYIEPIAPAVRQALSAMDELDKLLQSARRDCS